MDNTSIPKVSPEVFLLEDRKAVKSGIKTPTVREQRWDYIESAANSYKPLYQIFEQCLEYHGFETIHQWSGSHDDDRAFQVIQSFLQARVTSPRDVLDGILRPVSLADAKRNLIVWIFYGTLTSFSSFRSRLQELNPQISFDLADQLSEYRKAFRNDPRLNEPEDWCWAAHRQVFIDRLEGSNRSLSGRALESCAREALKRMIAEGWEMEVNEKEAQVTGKDGQEQRVDLLVKGMGQVFVLHMKSSQLYCHGYSGIYSRETSAITAAIKDSFGAEVKTTSATFFMGRGWNSKRLSGTQNPIEAPNLLDLDNQAREDWFYNYFTSSALLSGLAPQVEEQLDLAA